MKEFVDEKGNLIFEVNSKRISINISKLRILTKANVFSVFGSMKSLRGRLCDYGLSIKKRNKKGGWIRLNLKKIVNPEYGNFVIQREIIEVLSHEARHIYQPECKNRLLKFHKKIYISFFLPLVIISTLAIITQIICLIVGIYTSIYLIILLFFCFVSIIFIEVSYSLDPEEIDARVFAEKAIRDKKWLEIVQVKTIK